MTRRKRPTRGLFVVLEGIDGGGKTQQCRRLAKALRLVTTEHVQAFSDSKHGHWGKVAREAARDDRVDSVGRIDDAGVAEFRLIAFCRDRAELAENAILPVLAAGGIAICDRWEHSSWAYHRAAGVPMHRIRLWTRKYRPIVSPDVAFLIELPPKVALARIDRGRLLGLRPALRHHYEDESFLERVARCYETPPADAGLAPLVVVNGARDAEKITDELVQRVLAARRAQLARED